MSHRLMLLLCVLALGPRGAGAAIQYDTDNRRLWVTDFPETLPCTLDKVLAADRINGWNTVDHDASTDTYTVHAHLFIGANDGTDTYFQMGSSRHPRPTLVLYGNLVVHPSWIRNQNAGQARRVNRLTVGSATDTNISVTIRIGDTEEGNRHNLYVGAIPHTTGVSPHWSGQLHMHNSICQPVTPDRAHALGATGKHRSLYLAGNSIHLFNSRFSWVKGAMANGLVMHLDTVVRNCVFEHGGIGLNHYKETEHKKDLIRGCTFRDLGVAVNSHELVMVMTDCTFEDNDRNWVLDNCRYLMLVDCRVEPSRRGDIYTRNARAKKVGWYPELISRRHVIVEVTDPDNQPVPGATVQIRGPDTGRPIIAVTDQGGRTPDTTETGALLLTDLRIRATDTPEAPVKRTLTYHFTVKAAGFRPAVVRDVRPETPWAVINVKLER